MGARLLLRMPVRPVLVVMVLALTARLAWQHGFGGA